MTLFEYLAIAYSLVFGFAAMRLLGGLPSAIDAQRRYWVHLGFVLILLYSTASVFWVFWSYKNVEWDFLKFLLSLTSPACLFYLTATMVPENPAEVASWREHYYQVRLRYFLGVCCWSVAIAVSTTVLVDMPLTHPTRIASGLILATGGIGAVTDDPRVHGGMVFVIAAAFAVFSTSVLLQPGPLAR